MSSTNSPSSIDVDALLAVHRGAIDQTTITSEAPTKVMKRLNDILKAVGVKIQEESAFRYRCIRPRRSFVDGDAGDDDAQSTISSATTDTTESAITDSHADSTSQRLEAVTVHDNTDSRTNINYETRRQSQSCFCSLYGPITNDPADEVRFSVEITKLEGLTGTYSVDIRRLKGGLKGYKYVYDAIRDRAELNR